MNLIILDKKDFISEDTVRLTGRRTEHVFSIQKAETGRTLNIGLLNGNIGKGSIISISKICLEMKVIFTEKPPPPLPLTLILALPRPKTFKKVIHAAVSMGVKKIYFIESWKVDKSYWQSPVLTEEELDKQIILALEQGKDTILPEIIFKRRFKPFTEDDIPDIIHDSYPILAHPTSSGQCPYNINKHITLAIGPEGGFTEYEIDLFTKQGFREVSIGKRVLRVEVAVPAIINRLI
jgi:16S rRNA (uracil1498-N3)-methyltransferase